jgi:hypothetical protein
VTLEQDSVGGSVITHPRRKVVTTAPVELPLGGRLAGGQITKEELLVFWENALRRARVEIREASGSRASIRPRRASPSDGARRYPTRAVLLAVGRRGRRASSACRGGPPRRLPARRRRAVPRPARVLVVGGG